VNSSGSCCIRVHDAPSGTQREAKGSNQPEVKVKSMLATLRTRRTCLAPARHFGVEDLLPEVRFSASRVSGILPPTLHYRRLSKSPCLRVQIHAKPTAINGHSAASGTVAQRSA
jgi:hypothetical protein